MAATFQEIFGGKVWVIKGKSLIAITLGQSINPDNKTFIGNHLRMFENVLKMSGNDNFSKKKPSFIIKTVSCPMTVMPFVYVLARSFETSMKCRSQQATF